MQDYIVEFIDFDEIIILGKQMTKTISLKALRYALRSRKIIWIL